MKWYLLALCVVGFVVGLFFVRIVSSRYIDDVNPLMGCTEEYLLKSDVLYVVPYFDGVMINESREWCDFILSLDREIGMHGIRHSYGEFSYDVSLEDLELGMGIFESCFGFRPSRFKAPQLKLSSGNRELVEGLGMEVDGKLSQVSHKVYHCNDSGIMPNWFHSLL